MVHSTALPLLLALLPPPSTTPAIASMPRSQLSFAVLRLSSVAVAAASTRMPSSSLLFALGAHSRRDPGLAFERTFEAMLKTVRFR
jgi:hypothetical protein